MMTKISRSFCFNKVAGLQAGTLLRKRFWYGCFPVNFVKILRTRFSLNTSKLLLLRFEEVIIQNMYNIYIHLFLHSLLLHKLFSLFCMLSKRDNQFSPSAPTYFFSLICMLSKRDNHNFKKTRERTNLKINLKMHYTQVSFIWIKQGRMN